MSDQLKEAIKLAESRNKFSAKDVELELGEAPGEIGETKLLRAFSKSEDREEDYEEDETNGEDNGDNDNGDEDEGWSYEYNTGRRSWKFRKDGRLIGSVILSDVDRKALAEVLDIGIEDVDEEFGADETAKFLLNSRKGVKAKHEEKKEKAEAGGVEPEAETTEETTEVLENPRAPPVDAGGNIMNTLAPGAGIGAQTSRLPHTGETLVPNKLSSNRKINREVTGRKQAMRNEEIKDIALKLRKIATETKFTEETVDILASYYLDKLQKMGVDVEAMLGRIQEEEEASTNSADAELSKEARAAAIAEYLQEVGSNPQLTERQVAKIAEPYLQELIKLGYGNPLRKREDTWEATRKFDGDVNRAVEDQIQSHTSGRKWDREGNPVASERLNYPEYPRQDPGMASKFEEDKKIYNEFTGEKVAEEETTAERTSAGKNIKPTTDDPGMAFPFEEDKKIVTTFGKLSAIKDKLANLKKGCVSCDEPEVKEAVTEEAVTEVEAVEPEEVKTAEVETPEIPESEETAKVAEEEVVAEEEAVEEAPTGRIVTSEEDLKRWKVAVTNEFLSKLALCGDIVDIECGKGLRDETVKTERMLELFAVPYEKLETIYAMVQDFEPRVVMEKKADSVLGLQPPFGGFTQTSAEDEIDGLFNEPIRKHR